MKRCTVDYAGVRAGMGERWEPYAAYTLDRARAPSGKAALRVLMRELAVPAIPPADLERIDVPTSLIWGRHDPVNRLRVAEAASERYGWPLHVIEHAGDDPPIEQPEAFLTSAARRDRGGGPMNYRLAYAIGFHPWEDLAEHPPYAETLLELVAREEDGREAPYGKALDIGTGSAVWGVRLAKRGWAVTGVDIVEKALGRARERAAKDGVAMQIVHGDVTALSEAGVGSGFRLLLDTGTFHGLDEAQRLAMGREVTAVAAPDATLILDCFAPRRRGPLPRGASRADIEKAFPGWKITDVEVADTEPDPIARLFKFEERFYRLRRE